MNHFVLGLTNFDLLNCKLSGTEAMLLQSENLLMKMRIQQLEFDLETEKRRSVYFDGISKIALLELEKGNWVKCVQRRERVSELVREFQCQVKHFQVFKTQMNSCVSRMESLVCSLNALLK